MSNIIPLYINQQLILPLRLQKWLEGLVAQRRRIFHTKFLQNQKTSSEVSKAEVAIGNFWGRIFPILSTAFRDSRSPQFRRSFFAHEFEMIES